MLELDPYEKNANHQDQTVGRELSHQFLRRRLLKDLSYFI
jgi:hypothetical protein